MLISTKGRYALRILIDLAEHRDGSYITVKEISTRQDISPKYMERIMSILTKGKLVEGHHGKGGGYRLPKPPAQYRVGDILRLTEETLAPVACLSEGSEPCSRVASCKTLSLWAGLEKTVNDYLNSFTLDDLIHAETAGDYVI